MSFWPRLSRTHDFEDFEWHLPDQVRHAFGDLNHVKVLLPAHQFHLHRLVLETDCLTVGGARANGIYASQAELRDDGRPRDSLGGARVHESFHFHLPRPVSASAGLLQE